ncbi:hypothetical protein [Polyangium sp. y55x31]|uniref:hypothetical protein n=1 Tax=Polyangium sp. y55x31 TaxID=3042688 RepID=UPI002482B1C5|nr:hypothetical protein [Polyangium sp. y55x31]MDI1483606.1 hypothetical protein [Polyangium sp. y55x31]
MTGKGTKARFSARIMASGLMCTAGSALLLALYLQDTPLRNYLVAILVLMIGGLLLMVVPVVASRWRAWRRGGERPPREEVSSRKQRMGFRLVLVGLALALPLLWGAMVIMRLRADDDWVKYRGRYSQGYSACVAALDGGAREDLHAASVCARAELAEQVEGISATLATLVCWVGLLLLQPPDPQ